MPKESLFARPAPKRTRVCLMLAGSLLLHGGIIGFAAMWKTPEQPPADAPMEIDDYPAELPVGPAQVDMIEPAAISPNDPPPVLQTDVSETTPPTPNVELELAEPQTTPPPPRRVTTVRSNNGPTSAHAASPGQPNGTPGNRPVGPGATANANAWFMPHPSYPRNVLGARPTGVTAVRITTDASGQISNVEVTRSAGNPVLDSHTVSYVRGNWHGPPNASRTAEFVYQIK